MARHEADREDLLAEATGLSPRAEWDWNGMLVTAGLRRTGAVSIYLGGDEMYQLDVAGRLRRALVDGCLYRTQGDTLARLLRVRTPHETQLQRQDLSPEELAGFLARMQLRLRSFLTAADAGVACIGRAVPDADAADAILKTLRSMPGDGELAPALTRR